MHCWVRTTFPHCSHNCIIQKGVGLGKCSSHHSILQRHRTWVLWLQNNFRALRTTEEDSPFEPIGGYKVHNNSDLYPYPLGKGATLRETPAAAPNELGTRFVARRAWASHPSFVVYRGGRRASLQWVTDTLEYFTNEIPIVCVPTCLLSPSGRREAKFTRPLLAATEMGCLLFSTTQTISPLYAKGGRHAAMVFTNLTTEHLHAL